jgi:hypothetical protein
MLLSGMNIISVDSYFIKLTDQEDVYVHPVGELSSTEDAFVIKEGVKGAGIWSKSNAERFIKESEADNLEIVSVRSILGEDGSSN